MTLSSSLFLSRVMWNRMTLPAKSFVRFLHSFFLAEDSISGLKPQVSRLCCLHAAALGRSCSRGLFAELSCYACRPFRRHPPHPPRNRRITGRKVLARRCHLDARSRRVSNSRRESRGIEGSFSRSASILSVERPILGRSCCSRNIATKGRSSSLAE